MLLLEGRRMRLAYFASPYELLDVKRPGHDRNFTREGNINNLHTKINIYKNYLYGEIIFKTKLWFCLVTGGAVVSLFWGVGVYG